MRHPKKARKSRKRGPGQRSETAKQQVHYMRSWRKLHPEALMPYMALRRVRVTVEFTTEDRADRWRGARS